MTTVSDRKRQGHAQGRRKARRLHELSKSTATTTWRSTTLTGPGRSIYGFFPSPPELERIEAYIEAYIIPKRPILYQKRPILYPKRPITDRIGKRDLYYTKRTVSKETSYSVKRDLVQCQKRPSTVSKETYYNIKRDLLQCQKKPRTVSKET